MLDWDALPWIKAPRTVRSIHDLPVELLTDVFCFYCEQNEDLHPTEPAFSVVLDCKKLRTPFRTITSTCEHWRDIVFGSPRFWSSFSVHFDYTTEDKQCGYLLEALSRTGNVKLRLNIAYTDASLDFDDADPSDIQRFAVIAGMLDRANRWRDVRLELPSHIFGRVIRYLGRNDTPPHGYFPNLERLDCSDLTMNYPTRARHHYLDLYKFNIFNPCPALKHLSLNPFYYAQLRNLKIEELYVSPLSTLLSQCSSLTSLVLTTSGEYFRKSPFMIKHDGKYSKSNPLYYPSLTTLSLPDYNPLSSIGWADVRFPSLDTLHIGRTRHPGKFQALIDMLKESGCNLQTMILGAMPAIVLRDLLSFATSLKSLTLTMQHLNHYLCLNKLDRFLAPLYGTELGVSVPGLSSLKIEIHPGDLPSGRLRAYTYPEFTSEDAESAVALASDTDDFSSDLESDFDSDSDTSSEAYFEAYSDQPDTEATSEADPGVEIEADREDDTKDTTTSEGPPGENAARLIAAEISLVYTVVNRLRFMVKSRYGLGGGPSVRIKTKPYIDLPPLPSNVSADDVLTHLPDYLLAVERTGVLERLLTLEFVWE
ncbi:hypothetical protein F5880DRAFT_468795 [Lentinula raphanica]|nr:hypothetical protein F5880DRAFT_468795 [Lentinula raphanica]